MSHEILNNELDKATKLLATRKVFCFATSCLFLLSMEKVIIRIFMEIGMENGMENFQVLMKQKNKESNYR